MVNFKPTRIQGRWREGFALDYHTVSSTYLGDDEYGHPRFDTKRSEIGELLYRLKYGSDNSAIEEIVSAAAGFMAQWKPGIDLLVPVPPTRSDRTQQPVLVLAAALGDRLGIPLAAQAITRVKQPPQAKNIFDFDEKMQLLAGAYAVDPNQTHGCRVLLLDDVYQSGATMNTAASALYDGGGAAEVHALAITRTRSRS